MTGYVRLYPANVVPMDEEESIAHLMGLAGDGVAVSYNTPGNPFQWSETVTRSPEAIAENRKYAMENDRSNRRSLLQRTEELKPRLPPCLTRATKVCKSAQTIVRPRVNSTLSTLQTLKPKKHEHNQLMSEFIQEKREIFLFQLFINKKENEIRKFHRQQVDAEQRIKDREKEILSEIEINKLTTIQLEATLAKYRHNAELAAQQHTRYLKQMKHIESNVESIKSAISKNEDILNTYRPYLRFLEIMLPQGETSIDYFFRDPSLLIDEIHRMENENLFIINHCQHLDNVLKTGIESIDADILKTVAAEQEMMMRINSIEQERQKDYEMSEQQKQLMLDEDTELTHLKRIIKQTYMNCLENDKDLAAISMLEKLENHLERMYDQCDCVDPEFLAYKSSMRDKERRERQRKEWHERREREQQRKMEQAIERAQKPIPRRTGRPVNERTLPIKIVKPDDEALKMKLMEQQHEEKMLFVGSDDE